MRRWKGLTGKYFLPDLFLFKNLFLVNMHYLSEVRLVLISIDAVLLVNYNKLTQTITNDNK